MKKCPLYIILACMYAQAGATTIAHWTFESSLPAATDAAVISGLAAEIGVGSASGMHASATTDWSNPVGNGSNESFNANNWAVGDYFQFQFSSLEYADLHVSFDQTSSGTGPADFEFQYSIDGTSFMSLGGYKVLQNGSGHPAWAASATFSDYQFVFDLSGLSVLENASSVYLRLADASTVNTAGGTVSGGGTSRLDNFLVNATPLTSGDGQSVPDSGGGAAALSGALLILALTRYRRIKRITAACVRSPAFRRNSD